MPRSGTFALRWAGGSLGFVFAMFRFCLRRGAGGVLEGISMTFTPMACCRACHPMQREGHCCLSRRMH